MLKLLGICIVALSVVAMSGCKKAGESLTEKLMEKALEKDGGGKAKVDLASGKVSIKTDKGEFTASSGDSVSIPASFPKDVPVYKGAKILTAINTPDGQMMTLQTKDDMKTVADTYVVEMKAGNWKEEASMNMGESTVLAYSKGTRKASITIAKGDKETTLMITASQEPAQDEAKAAQ